MGKEFPFKSRAGLATFKIRHKHVWLVYSPEANLFAFVSGNTFSEARKRLQEDDPIWNNLKTFLASWPVGLFDSLKILDTESIDSEQHFISHKATRIKK